MFVEITNEPRPYAWGSRTLIPEFLGRAPSGYPEAELWLGAHPLCPSRILDPSRTGGHEHLDAWIAAEPERTLGADRDGDELPFLMKLLAAGEPLSIQVHPDAEQAREGFEAENARGVPVDSPVRTYKDPRHKPEIALALEDPFDALAGFRPLERTRRLLTELSERAAHRPDAQRILTQLAAQLEGPTEPALRQVMAQFLDDTAAAPLLDAVTAAVAEPAVDGEFAAEITTLAEIAAARPGDPGLLVALLLNRVTLERDQAVYLPPGNVHAYLRGLAVEVMAASDNVVRAGLTGKHLDVDELQRITRFAETPGPVHTADQPAEGVAIYRPDERDFQLSVLSAPADGEVSAELNGPGIALVLDGAPQLRGRHESAAPTRGQALFITPDECSLHVSGTGRIALATTGR
ncbi:mannose-6-phosphate isomerase, class I [Brachybacterium sp. GCM10030267]|uniref:mannose-6-phosphate isomerase, class I n=1 Tax=unclassified Brachybacterium TaxID=2623841 RepID=UPI0036170865